MLTRRKLLAASAGALALGGTVARAQAEWPNKPVKVIVPYPPGGGADTTARIVYQKLGDLWGKQFVIDNRGGAGGTIAEAIAAKSEPDGYTILHDATAMSINPALYPKLSFDYGRDFQPVAARTCRRVVNVTSGLTARVRRICHEYQGHEYP